MWGSYDAISGILLSAPAAGGGITGNWHDDQSRGHKSPFPQATSLRYLLELLGESSISSAVHRLVCHKMEGNN